MPLKGNNQGKQFQKIENSHCKKKKTKLEHKYFENFQKVREKERWKIQE